MSVQKTRLEIRISEQLKDDMQRFCDKNNIDLTYYLTTLIRSHLKRSDALTQEKREQWQWIGDVDDMPANVTKQSKKWRKIA